jgi:hypothetical protein
MRIQPTDHSATWDTPPPVSGPLYPAFKHALKRYLRARKVEIPILSAAQVQNRDRRLAKIPQPPQEQPECIKGGVSAANSNERNIATTSLLTVRRLLCRSRCDLLLVGW